MYVMVIVMHEWSVEFGKASHNWCLPTPTQPRRAHERKSAHNDLHTEQLLFELEIYKMQHLEIFLSWSPVQQKFENLPVQMLD